MKSFSGLDKMKAPAISVTDRPLVVFLPLIDKQFEDHEKADSSADATNIMDTIAQCEEYILSEYGTTVSFVSGEEVAPEHSRKKFSHKERFETYIQSYVKKNANANKSILVFYNVKISKAQFATLIEAKEYSRAIIDAIVHFDGLPFHHKPALEEDGGEKEDKKDADSDDDYPMEEFEEEEISRYLYLICKVNTVRNVFNVFFYATVMEKRLTKIVYLVTTLPTSCCKRELKKMACGMTSLLMALMSAR